MNKINISNSVKITLEKAIKKYKLKKFIKTVYDNTYIKKLIILSDSLNKHTSQSIFDTENVEHDDKKFKILSKELCDRQLIKTMENVLKEYLNYIDAPIRINHKDILSAWMIYYCQSIIEDYINKEYMYDISKKLIEQFIILNKIDTNFDIINFNKILLIYSDLLTIYKESDKIEKINYFVREWKSLEETKISILESKKYDDDQKNQVISIIEENKQKIQNYILKLNSNYDFDFLKKIINNTQNLRKKILENYNKILENELELNVYDIFIKIMNETKAFLIMFNKSKKDEYQYKIDATHYSEMLREKILTNNDMLNCGDYLLNEILKLGSSSLENSIKIEWEKLKKTNQDLNINKTISSILIFIMNIIEQVKLEIYDYKLLLELINFQ